MEDILITMNKNFKKLYEERLTLVNSTKTRENVASLVETIEKSFHIRESEFQKHQRSFELICEKQENSGERKS